MLVFILFIKTIYKIFTHEIKYSKTFVNKFCWLLWLKYYFLVYDTQLCYYQNIHFLTFNFSLTAYI